MVIFLLESMEKLSGISQNLRTVLKSLADLFVLHGITENSGSFIEVGDIEASSLVYIVTIHHSCNILVLSLSSENENLLDRIYLYLNKTNKLHWKVQTFYSSSTHYCIMKVVAYCTGKLPPLYILLTFSHVHPYCFDRPFPCCIRFVFWITLM